MLKAAFLGRVVMWYVKYVELCRCWYLKVQCLFVTQGRPEYERRDHP